MLSPLVADLTACLKYDEKISIYLMCYLRETRSNSRSKIIKNSPDFFESFEVFGGHGTKACTRAHIIHNICKKLMQTSFFYVSVSSLVLVIYGSGSADKLIVSSGI